MFGEKYKSPRMENVRKKDAPESKSRRSFLQAAAAVAGLWALKKYGGVEKALNILEKGRSQHDFEVLYATGDPDIEAVSKVLDFFADEPLVIDEKVIENTQEYWRVRYMTDVNLADSLVGAKHKIEWWTDDLAQIFSAGGDEKVVAEVLGKYPKFNLDNDEGRRKYVEREQAASGTIVMSERKRELEQGKVPVKYMYLAIPESHWNFGNDAISSAGARGPYQFTASTARMFGLKEGARFDERDNPLKSGGACARHLLGDFQRFKDWELALSAYNGGFINDYRRECFKRKSACTYKGFMGFLSKEVNAIRKEIRQIKFLKQKVGQKTKITDFVAPLGIGVAEFKSINGGKLKGDWLRPGAKVNVPASKEYLLKLFKSRIWGIAQNLNYPPKFNAVMELIEKGVG